MSDLGMEIIETLPDLTDHDAEMWLARKYHLDAKAVSIIISVVRIYSKPKISTKPI